MLDADADADRCVCIASAWTVRRGYAYEYGYALLLIIGYGENGILGIGDPGQFLCSFMPLLPVVLLSYCDAIFHGRKSLNFACHLDNRVLKSRVTSFTVRLMSICTHHFYSTCGSTIISINVRIWMQA